ncbi:MAG: 4Fe-4S dicluster domain-containing protein [Pollutimonas bauzanensis]
MPPRRIPPASGPGSHSGQEPPDDGRRRFLKTMAVSAALAGAGCGNETPEAIVPYVDMPEGTVPGEPVFYATTLLRGGYGMGVLVETNMGRPIKVEGNPAHPASLGATDVFSQAAILQLWDPDRSRTVMKGAQISTWDAFQGDVQPRLQALDATGGKGLRLLTGSLTSPTLLAQIGHRHDPARDAAAGAAASRLFGKFVAARYRLDQARVVVTLDCDLFSLLPNSARNAHDFMQRRRGSQARNRLYAVEATPTLCGAVADQRLSLPPAAIDGLLRRLAEKLGVAPGDGPALMPQDHPAPGAPGGERWISALAAQLRAAQGASLLAPGPALSMASHELAWRLNQHLGNIGKTVIAVADQGQPAGLAELVDAMFKDEVQVLAMLGSNPGYDAPAALDFSGALGHVPCSVHMGLYRDETGHSATWHLPQAHDLESWGDACSLDGTASLAQPLIAPLYGGLAPHALMALLAGDTEKSAYEHVRKTWRERWQAGDDAEFEIRWSLALRNGLIEDPGALAALAPPVWPSATPGASGKSGANTVGMTNATRAEPAVEPEPRTPASGPDLDPAAVAGDGASPILTAIFVLDASVAAGEFSNSAWLQELPRPFTKITWDNAAQIGPATARRHGLQNGDIVAIRSAGQGAAATIQAPVWITPGQAELTLALPLGYGRRHAGSTGNGVGFDAYPLQGADAAGGPLRTVQVTIAATGRRHSFARTQNHMEAEGRETVRLVGVGAKDAPAASRVAQPSLYPPRDYPGYAWGMSVDLDSCIGCNACTIACQAENNIPVVGKQEVANGREMHWIRIDLYQDAAAARTLFQPVACMHCENAPCEVVCPVGATMHDQEGLNVQVYNRCVGTRFCSNNCPYKARRFNFYQYADTAEASSRARQNPEVTVRRRGVMEKCTYCVQRISHARIESEKAGRQIADGEIVTACEAVCPTQAIVFGDINDPDSRVSAAKASGRDYALLHELNTRPRTTYLARIIDPDADLEADHG